MSRGQSDRFIDDGYAEDPERLSISAEMAEVPRSAAQISEATGISLTRVRRHIREMREAGLVETVMRKSKRGTVENFNLLSRGLNRNSEEYAELSLDERRKLYGNILRIILTEASRALVTHPTNRGLERLDSEIMRIPVVTDEAGWKELGDMHREFCDRVLAVRERIRERLEESGEEGFKATSIQMFFEAETTD